MKNLLILSTCLVLTLQVLHLNAQSSIHRFELNKSAIPIGKVLLYSKSNIDGTHSSHTALYVKSEDQLESLKWNDNYSGATLVKAWMNWETFSVEKFETFRLDEQGNGQIRAKLSTDHEHSRALVEIPGVFKDTADLPAWPWHSYDFDFASLSICWAHLKDKKKTVDLAISDFKSDGNGGGSFAYRGQIQLAFEQKEKMNGRTCYKYSVDGPGLENRGGHIWMDAEEHFIVEYRIDLPDEPGYKDGRLSLESVRLMSPKEWESFKKEKVKP